MTLYYESGSKDFTLLQGDCLSLIDAIEEPIDMMFADPPYFLSNGGLSIQSGKIVSVDKGDWDVLVSDGEANDFTYEWLGKAREKLSDKGTIWVSGTHHNIFTLGRALTELGFKILNMVTWEKSNPPPNFSCRFFTHSTEFIIWARKDHDVSHYYNYALMKKLNGNRQMKDVWKLPAIAKWEKACGKHPTQKPLPLLAQIVMASTKKGDLVVDPFSGSSTTGIASAVLGRRYIGIERENDFIQLAKDRHLQLADPEVIKVFSGHFERLLNKNKDDCFVDFKEMVDSEVEVKIKAKAKARIKKEEVIE